MAEPKVKTVEKNFRLTPECIALIAKLTVRMGLKSSGVIETAVRDLAKREGVRLD